MKPHWPVDMKWSITQKFGENVVNYHLRNGHPGIDFDTIVQSPWYAVADGDIKASGYRASGGYGREIFLQVGKWNVIYGHALVLCVSVGEHVKRGQIIGYSGGALSDPLRGNSTGPHTHFEVRDTTQPQTYPLIGAVDPEIWLATDLDGDTQPAVSTPEIPDNSAVDSIKVITKNINLRREPNTDSDNPPIGEVLRGMTFKKAGLPLPGTGKVIAWQPIIVYVATGVVDNGITEEYTE
jgi:murein DD-endopeptidase MepM/ murein hydrolase activator NlpD